MSHIRYGITVWHHGQIALRKKIQACSNKFLRMIFFMGWRDSVRPLMKEQHLLSVNQIYQSEIGKVMQRVVLGSSPKSFIDMFDLQRKRCDVRTRSSSDYIRSFFSKKRCQQSICYEGPVIWDKISSSIKQSNVIDSNENPTNLFKTFKNNIKKFALENFGFV